MKGFVVLMFMVVAADFQLQGSPSFQTHKIVPEKELLITDLAIVDADLASYPGALSFGHVIEELAGEEGAKDWVLDWVKLWETEQRVDARSYMCGESPASDAGEIIPSRPAIRDRLLEPWKAKDGFKGQTDEAWEINLANAPFRLLAIANRLDLGAGIVIGERQQLSVREHSRAYQVPEIRLVFGATDQDGKSLEGGFTMIFEYGFRPESKEALAQVAAYWHQLGTYKDFGTPYQQHLTQLVSFYTERLDSPEEERSLTGLTAVNGETVTVTGPRTEAPLLRQIRTNDGAFGEPREFRQCEMGREGLVAALLDNTPSAAFADTKEPASRLLTKHLNKYAREIKAGTHFFPGTLGRYRDQVQVLAGHSQIPNNDPEFFWDLRRIRDDEVRRQFSMGTCNGCHSGETQTRFFHIPPREVGAVSEISAFLQKGHVPMDPENPRRRTEEVSEMDQRELVLTALLNPSMRPAALRRLLRGRLRQSH